MLLVEYLLVKEDRGVEDAIDVLRERNSRLSSLLTGLKLTHASVSMHEPSAP